MSEERAPDIRAVPRDAPVATAVFCGYCGKRPADDPGESRVCPSCGLGLLLTAEASFAPATDEAFAVIDPALTVRALSAAAERLFDVEETRIVGQPVDALVVAADAAPGARARLAGELARIARRVADEPVTAVVMPAAAFGVRYRARIGPCEPGPAALLVVSAL